MPLFTSLQYDEAIASLQLAKTQVEPNGDPCAICGGDDHQAWECAWNPLRAMAAARAVYDHGHHLHEALHQLCGFNSNPVTGSMLAAIVPEGTADERFAREPRK